MLNIGRLAPGAADYYIGEVATSAEDYYTGKGESHGRWVGSLAPRLGLAGTVDGDDFRAVLAARRPRTGEHLARRAAPRTGRHLRVVPGQPGLFDDDILDVAQAAARLSLSTRHVRRLLSAGDRAVSSGRAPDPAKTLVGERVQRPHGNQKGLLAWSIPRFEVERFEADRRAVKARPGYDLTLRPPKSVSILWALADQEKRRTIRDAHREAVDAVVDYYESHALYARRGCADRGKVETEGLVAAAFDHRTSRAGDPLLHTHVVTANLTFTAEGKWQAIDGRPLYDHARSAGFLYQAHLRHTLTRALGVRFGQVRKGWSEVEGVPTEVIRAFSKRRDEIEDLVAESGYTSAKAHQTATLATRAAKDYGVDPNTLEGRWRAEAAALGFGSEQIKACFGHQVHLFEPSVDALFAHLGGPDGLTKQASTFTRREVVEALAERLGSSAPAGRIEQLADRFLASAHVVPLEVEDNRRAELVWQRDGNRRRRPDLASYSTAELLELEERLMGWATGGFGTAVPAARPGVIEAVLGRRGDLSAEQGAMVRAVCGPAPAIQPAAGRPGAGKTFAAAACVEAFVGSDVPVVGCALSATAAGELEAATNLGELTGRPATTIARLLVELGGRGLPRGTVVLVDEASMVGTRDLGRLTELAARAGGAVKLIGDPDQHGPIETGGIFRRLVADMAERVPQLVENNRQDDAEERAATEDFRNELVETALARYDAAGKVVRSATAAESYETIAADWYESVLAGSDDPMIAGPNRVRHALNARARAKLKEEGRLDGPVLVTAGREFLVGEWVVARKNAYHLRSADGSAFVKNGSAGRIVVIDPEEGTMAVNFDVEGRISLPATYLEAGWVEYGYARTTYGVQGATLGRALYHAGDQSSFEEGYVALTRGRAETRIYLVDGALAADEDLDHRAHEREGTGLDTVCRALERRRSKALAHDADPVAASCRRSFQGWGLHELRAERERLEREVIAVAPQPVDEALAGAERRRDALLARHRASSNTVTAQAGSAATLEGLERAIGSLERRIDGLRRAQQDHEVFLAVHAEDVERLSVVRRAERARELQVRAGAAADPEEWALSILTATQQPAGSRQRRRDAVEEVAVYEERFSASPLESADAVMALLGDHPADAGPCPYERAEAAVREAEDFEEPSFAAEDSLGLG